MTLENPFILYPMAASALAILFAACVYLVTYIDSRAADRGMVTEPAIDVPRLIEAIAMVENWDGKTMGKAGEWHRLQFKPATFAQFTSIELMRATPLTVEIVERKYVSWIVNVALPSLGLAQTVYNATLLH